MRRLIFSVALIITALSTTAHVRAESTAIINVNVIPMTSETVLRSQTVIVIDGVISAIGDVNDIAAPEDADVVDGTDRYLLPGLAEMHGHVTGTGDAQIKHLFSLFLANGVTTVRGMLGRPAHLELRDTIAAGQIFGPRLITSGPSFNGNSVNSVADARRKVREQHAAGYDFLKVHPGMTREEFIAMADTANELGIPFAGHVPAAVGLENALASGIATIDHLDGYMAAMMPANFDLTGGFGGFFGVMLADQVDRARIDELVAATLAAGTANVPTESLFERLVNDTPASELEVESDMRYMPVATVRQWRNAKERTLSERGFDPVVAAQAIEIRRQLIRALHDAGANLLLGSDAPQIFNVPGFSIHHELAFMVAAGLTPFEALQTGTTAPADFLGLNTGRIAVGKAADLVLLDANPLEDIGNTRRVHGVMAAGRWARASSLLDALDTAQ